MWSLVIEPFCSLVDVRCYAGGASAQSALTTSGASSAPSQQHQQQVTSDTATSAAFHRSGDAAISMQQLHPSVQTALRSYGYPYASSSTSSVSSAAQHAVYPTAALAVPGPAHYRLIPSAVTQRLLAVLASCQVGACSSSVTRAAPDRIWC